MEQVKRLERRVRHVTPASTIYENKLVNLRCDTSVVWVQIWKYFTSDVCIEHRQVSSRPCI